MQHTHTHDIKQRNNGESQTSPVKGSLPQKSGSITEPFLEKKTMSWKVPCLNNSQKNQAELQEIKTYTTAKINEDEILLLSH